MKTVFLNPFEKYAENKLLVFGILITFIGSYLGYLFQGRFDGVLDLHFSTATPLEPLLDNITNIFSLFLVLFMLGKYINPKTRIVDIVTPILIARLPFYLLTFSNFKNTSSDLGQKVLDSVDYQNLQGGLKMEATDIAIMLAIAGITILFIIWFVLLLFNGFKVATNSKGIKNNLLFAGAIILAEILSKILFTLLN